MLDYLFAAGSALCATLLVYGGWLCLRPLIDNALRALLPRRSRNGVGQAMRKQKEA